MITLPARFATVLLPLLLTMFMTAIISGITTLRALGFTSAVFTIWPEAWLMSWAVAFPVMTVVLPAVRRLVSRLTSTS